MKDFVVDSVVSHDIAVIYPRGYLNNIVGEELEKECDVFLSKGIKKIVLDFEKTEFINSIGISILVSIIEKMEASNGILCFTSMRNLHEDIFQMLGLTKYVNVFPNKDEAIKRLRNGLGK